MAEPQEHAVEEKERQGMGTQLAGGLEDAQPAEGGGREGTGGLWGQAGWTMVAPGRLTGVSGHVHRAFRNLGHKKKEEKP